MKLETKRRWKITNTSISGALTSMVAAITRAIIAMAHGLKMVVVAEGVETDERSLFSEGATAHGLICLRDGLPIGFAVFFFSYSTWLGSNCLYLEDLYINPEQRGGGAGKKLLRHLAKIAYDNGCGRFEWSVLDWNEPAIAFYKSIGAQPQEEWVRYRMEGNALRDFAQG